MKFFLSVHVILLFRFWRQTTTIKSVCVSECLCVCETENFRMTECVWMLLFLLLNWSNSYVTQIEFLRSQKWRKNKKERKHRSPFVNFFLNTTPPDTYCIVREFIWLFLLLLLLLLFLLSFFPLRSRARAHSQK